MGWGGSTPGPARPASVARRLAMIVVGLAILVFGAGPAGGQSEPEEDAEETPAGPKVAILEEEITARFRVDQGAVVFHLPVKVTGAELPTAGLGAELLRTGGGVVQAIVVSPDEDGTIAVDEVVEVDVAFPSEKLTGAGGIVSLTRSSGGTRVSLATTEVAFSRQVSAWGGWLIVLAPGGAAIVTILIGAAMIRGARPEDAEQTVSARREKARKYLPRRVKWSFAEGWAGNLTAFGGAAASVLAATGVFDDFLPGLAVPPFITANILFIALGAAAPMMYTAATKQKNGDEELGTFWGLYAAATLSLWGVYGFLTLLIALVTELEGGPTELPFGAEVPIGPIELFFDALLIGAVILIGWYAVETLKKRAAVPEPPPDREVAVALDAPALAAAIDQAFDDADRPAEVATIVDALRRDGSDGKPMTFGLTVRLPGAEAGPPDAQDAWALF